MDLPTTSESVPSQRTREESPVIEDKVAGDPIEVPDAPADLEQAITPSPFNSASDILVLSANDAQANVAVRVRRPLDDRLSDLLHELRRSGNRSSKAEIIEMLLWELPPSLTDDIERRLTRFRSAASRR